MRLNGRPHSLKIPAIGDEAALQVFSSHS
jgi:hypothetical protein